ncbi:translocation/assembly module TamB domain-containing protein [Zoogloea sp.]|uniref:translocation/assembly module TamB domain-containing protein n=1 Tax=Zoogloea sp. TaxID=49181 RepID=UPI001415C4C9|nr:MAG: DUF490 domain-containing protein [Zoogloea sp.]
MGEVPDADERAAPPPEASRAGRRPAWPARGLRALLAALVGLVTAAILVLGWVGGTASGLRFAAGLAERLSGGLLVIEGADGYLLGGLRVGVLKVDTPGLRLELRNLELDWRPGALGSGLLDVERLAASEMVVATPPSAEPATVPLTLEIPLAVRVDQLRLDRLTLANLEGGRTAVPHLELTGLAGRLDSDGRVHRLAGITAGTPVGQVTADGQLDGRAPFPLHLQAGLATTQGGEAYSIKLSAGGRLEALEVAATAEGAGMTGKADLLATPFALLPLRSVHLRVTDLDPQRFHVSAPSARLDIDASLEPSARTPPAAGHSLAVEDWVVAGPLRVTNRKPGRHDAGELPLVSLATRLRWAGGELALSDLDLRLPGDGRVAGEASWQAPAAGKAGIGQGHSELRVSGLDVRRLDRRAVATQIAGTLALRGDGEAQVLNADLRDKRLALRLKARHAGGVLHLDEAVVRAAAARLALSGQLALAGDGKFEATGQLAHFDPRAFVPTAPPADLNADFSVRGLRSPVLSGTLDFELAPSRLEGKALSGKGALALEGSRLAAADVALDLAGNRLAAKGTYGRAGDALDIHVDAPVLAALGHGLAGRLRADGVLRGTPAQPAGEFDVQGERLAAGGVYIDRVAGRGRVAEGKAGALALNLAVSGVHRGEGDEALLQKASLVFEGTRARNTVRLDLDGLRNHALTTTLSGSLSDGPAWEGSLESLELRGAFPVKLLAPAALRLSGGQVRLGRAEFRGGAGGRYQFEETRWETRHLVARGRVTGIQVGLILDPATRNVQSKGDSLTIGGEWDVDIGEKADGFIRFFREKGDLVLQGDSPVQLGLDDLQLTVSAAASRLAFGFSAHGTQLGRLAGAGSALLERAADGTIRLVPGAPLLGSASLDMPSIAWAGPLADQNLKTGGSLKGDFTLAGTPARPETAGRIRGERLDFLMADQGLKLSGGTLVAEFNREVLRLDEFSFVSPNRVRPRESRIDVARLTRQPGTLDASGSMQLASGEGRFTFKAERLPLLQRADQWLILSGEGEVLTGWQSAHIKGRLAADAGFVELSRTPAPSLGDDVEVLDPRRNAKEPASPFQTGVDLAISLGNSLYVKALGLDTRLGGELRLRSGEGKPLSASGTINTVGGVFEGYGQKLSIERGIVTFNGPLANPGLNVVALRKGLAVEAGVGITGTARRPLVRLVSEPNVPDPEKLGWIVLGRPPDQGSGGEMALLLPAAQALLGGGGGNMSAGLANALGIDELSFGSSVDSRSRVQTSSVASGSVTGASSSYSGETVPGQVITIGKRLSAQAMLSFEQSVTGTSSVVKLTYQLTRRLSVIGRAGSENALDGLFSISFR